MDLVGTPRFMHDSPDIIAVIAWSHVEHIFRKTRKTLCVNQRRRWRFERNGGGGGGVDAAKWPCAPARSAGVKQLGSVVAVSPSGGRGAHPPKIVEFCTAKCLEITAISGVSRHIFFHHKHHR